ncbi:MAG: extracellular solute-binding protein, partial [Candidatus Methylomirabilota bacterium]
LLGITVAGALLGGGTTIDAFAQTTPPVEEELVLLSTIPKRMSDAALEAFKAFAAKKWQISIKTSSLHAGTPVAYGRVIEWKGNPEADIFWGGESALYDDLAAKGLLEKLSLPRVVWEAIPANIAKPKPIPVRDPNGFWVGSAFQVYGLVYNERLIERLGVSVNDWDDLLNPKVKGNVVQCAPTRSSSSHVLYEIFLQELGVENGWRWLERLAGQTGLFTARSRDVPAVVAKGEFAIGFAVPSIGAFDERLAGFPIRFVFARNSYVAPEVWGMLKGSKHPKAARAFLEFMLGEEGQRALMRIGLAPISPRHRIGGPPGSVEENAVEFMGGIRSFYDIAVRNVYDDNVARSRYQEVNEIYRKTIEARWEELKRRY